MAVYNVERYIHRCVDSLLAQTYHNIEVILIDDGSTDGSPAICDEYASMDHRVKTIHKINGGVSTARQAGLDAASGDYTIHADPDDYVETTMVKELLDEALRTNADIVTCDFFMNEKLKEQNYTDSADLLKRLIDVSCICVCWNSFIRRQFIVEHGISFSPSWLSMSEDFLFLIRMLVAGAAATHLHKAFYHYWVSNASSLSNRHSPKKLESIKAVISEMGTLVEAKDYDGFYNRKKYAIMYAYQGRMFSIIPTLYPEIHDRLKAEGKKDSHYGLDWQLSHALDHPRLTYYRSRIRHYAHRLKRLLHVPVINHRTHSCEARQSL